jgi:hypothetical protein
MAQWRLYANRKIDKWQGHSEKRTLWKALRDCTNPTAIREICDAKIAKWETDLQNQHAAKVKSWVNIVVNICLIALTILSLVMPLATIAAIGISIAALTIATNMGDLVNYLLDIFLKEKDLPKASLALIL